MADVIQPRGPASPTATPPTQTLGFMGGEQYNVNSSGYANAANQAGKAALGNLGVNTYTGYVPPAPAKYPVITADQAIQDLNSKQTNFNQIQQGMAAQQQINAVNQANQQAQQQVTNQTNAEKAKADALQSATSALTTQTPQEKSETTLSLEQINQRADQAYNDYKAQVDQIANGTFPLTPAEQAQIDYVKRQFEMLKQQQITANKNYEGGMNQLGIISGRSRYAPEIQVGLIQQAVTNGIQKVADIEAQAANTVAQLQQSFMDKNYERINEQYKALSGYLAQKSQTINQIAQNVREEAQLALAQHSQAYKEQQDELQRQKDAIQFALDNKITKPFYLLGNTAVDTKTGELINLAEYQRRTGQQVGLPEAQTDFSQIQTDVKTPQQREEEFKREQFDYSKTQDAIQNRFRQQELNISAGHLAVDRMNAATNAKNAMGLTPAQINTTVNQIANQFDNEPIVRAFNTVNEQVNFVKGLGDTPTDDQARIYAFAKVMDPNSAVREGEYKTVQSYSQALLQYYGLTAKRVFDNSGFLTNEARGFIENTLTNNLKSYEKQYNAVKSEYQRQIDDAYSGKPRQITGYDNAYQPTLDDYVKSNPDSLSLIQKIEKENPNYTDEDILQIITTSQPTQKASFVGPTAPVSLSPKKVGGLTLNLP